MNPRRVLILAHQELVPPPDATVQKSKGADWKTEFDVRRALLARGHQVEVLGIESDLGPVRRKIYEFRPHIAFNLLEDFHNIPIFDGNVVSYLELLKLPYTGCNPRGLIVTKDKALSKKIFHYHNISTPYFHVFPRNQRFRAPQALRYPVIVKSLVEEASFGISQSSIVFNESKLRERVEFIHQSIMTDALVERYIEGRELYGCVLGNYRAEVLPVWELIFRNPSEQMELIATRRVKWSPEYQKKYGITSGHARRLTDQQTAQLNRICKRVYKILGLNGYARFDFRLSPEGELFLLEANPNPHIGNGEDFADAALRAGLSYGDLIQKIIQLGLRWTPEGPPVWE